MALPASSQPPSSPIPRGALARVALGQTVFLVTIASLLSYASLRFHVQWSPPKAVRTVGIPEARASQSAFVWVDVRNPERYASAHLPGAVSFQETEAEASLEAVRQVWKTGKKLGVYGEGIGSERAERVAKTLKTALHTKEVYVLEGGWAAWPRP